MSLVKDWFNKAGYVVEAAGVLDRTGPGFPDCRGHHPDGDGHPST